MTEKDDELEKRTSGQGTVSLHAIFRTLDQIKQDLSHMNKRIDEIDLRVRRIMHKK